MIRIYNNSNIGGFDEVKSLIYDTLKGHKVLVIKQLSKLLSGVEKDKDLSILQKYKDFIENELLFTGDKRQYVYDSTIENITWATIAYDPEKSDSYMYSKTRQPLHTDNSWFSDPAQMNFFYMEKQVKVGGETTFYPLNRLIDDLNSDEPQLLDDLKNIEVTISKGEDKYFNKTTIINNDNIFWNYYRTNKSDKKVERMCDHFFKFLEKKESTKSVDIYKMSTDDGFCLNDLTMLHGRLSYKANKKNDRILRQSMWRSF